MYYGSKRRVCIFDFVVSPPGCVGYGRLRPLVSQVMSDYCEDAVDMVQFHIDRFDSLDDATSAGAVGVDEEIIKVLVSRGHARETAQLDLMLVAIHHLNRGGVMATVVTSV